jgi:uncharacterized protein DUF6804
MFKSQRSPDFVTIAGAAVAIGLLPLPPEYYMLLRLLLCGLCIYYLAGVGGISDREKWVLTGLAILHNPVAPVQFGTKPVWILLSAGTVLWLWLLGRRAH